MHCNLPVGSSSILMRIKVNKEEEFAEELDFLFDKIRVLSNLDDILCSK